MYCYDNNDRLPVYKYAGFPWDCDTTIMTNLIQEGFTQNILYCPAFSQFNDTNIWNCDIIHKVPKKAIGYFLLFSGPGFTALDVANDNTSISTPPTITVQTPGGSKTFTPTVSERELSTDATISPEYPPTFNKVRVNWSQPARSPHLNGNIPQGGNILYLDGHSSWLKFSEMVVRGSGSTGYVLADFWY
jgi:prepilin-type processing-associated H-X9-DG protein